MMDYVNLGRTGLKVSRICLGCMTYGVPNRGPHPWSLDEEKSRPFFKELVEFMLSGPVLLLVLEGEDAIAKNREIMGATDPAKAAPGTIRKLYAASIGENTVHGSDGPDTAKNEIAWFFAESELYSAK